MRGHDFGLHDLAFGGKRQKMDSSAFASENSFSDWPRSQSALFVCPFMT